MHIKTILFDLGGVLVELPGMPVILAWSGLTEPELRRRWMLSPAVRKFESGQSGTDEFATAMIDELNLATNEAEFIAEFTRWPKGLFEGALELLTRLRQVTTIACLSNTNHLHWERFRNETRMLDLFHVALASHKTGLLKPDAVTYAHAVEKLKVEPGAILFLDDNQINVDAACAAGMESRLTKGIEQAQDHIREFGLLR